MATAPTQVTQYQTGFAPEIAPYMQNLLGTAASTLYQYKTDSKGKVILDANGMPQISGFQPYQEYTGDRNAAYQDLQTTAQTAAKALGQEQYSKDAAAGLKSAAADAVKYSYKPDTASSQYKDQANYTYTDPTNQFTKQADYVPSQFNYQSVAADKVAAPNLRDLTMQAAQNVNTQSITDPGAVSQYMSPYMQNVVDIQQREAMRQAGMLDTQRNAKAAQAGAFGGARHGIENAEAQRNLNTRLEDIQAKGLQDAYQQAQGQFNAEQQARLQANLANQNVQQQAGVQNLSAALQTQGLGAQTGLQAQQSNQSAGLQALLANQQAGLTTQQQQELANQFGYGQKMSNAQLAAQYGLSADQLAAQQKQFGYGQQMTEAQLAAQYGLSADQLNAQQKQYASGIGLQGLQAGMTGYQNLGGIGQDLYGQTTGNINLQNQIGTQQQQNVQDVLNTKYADWQQKQNFPYQQMSYLSDMIHGAPMQQQSSSMYQAAPSTASQVAGLGTAAVGAYGMYKGLTKAKGGTIKSKPKTKAGLANLLIHNMA